MNPSETEERDFTLMVKPTDFFLSLFLFNYTSDDLSPFRAKCHLTLTEFPSQISSSRLCFHSDGPHLFPTTANICVYMPGERPSCGWAWTIDTLPPQSAIVPMNKSFYRILLLTLQMCQSQRFSFRVDRDYFQRRGEKWRTNRELNGVTHAARRQNWKSRMLPCNLSNNSSVLKNSSLFWSRRYI